MLSKDELNALVGRTVYGYSFKGIEKGFGGSAKFSHNIKVEKMKIVSVQDVNKSVCESHQAAWIGSTYVPVDNIGNPSVVASEWFSFERNDKQARAVFEAYENKSYLSDYESLMEDIRNLKYKYNKNISAILEDEIDDSSFAKEEEIHDGIEL